MLILCPNCRHTIRIRDLHPGKFTPRCPRCEQTFQFTVPDRKGETPVVSALEPSLFAEPVAQALEPPEQAPVPAITWPVLDFWADPRRKRPGGLPRGTPRLLGGHILLRLLGHGPRGRAYLAWPFSLTGTHVLKQVANDRATSPVLVAHHVQEAFTALQISHPNLVRLRSIGAARGRVYSVVEFADGPMLSELLKSCSRLDPYQATVLILQAARGLQSAHAQGMWHKDVRPENLFVSDDGLVRLDDLGLEMTPSLAEALESLAQPSESPSRSKKPASTTRAVVGTPHYMAPEQAADPTKIDGRADIYSLGATYYHLVTGRPPFQGENAVELLRQHQEESPIPAEELVEGLPRAISDAIRTMLQKHPNERYPSVGVVIDVLERILDLDGSQAAEILSKASETIQEAADFVQNSPSRRVRGRILALCGLIGMCCIGFLAILGLYWPAIGILIFGAMTFTAIAVGSGILHRSIFLNRFVEVVIGDRASSWFILAIALTVAIAAIIWQGAFLPWFLLACVAGLTTGYLILLDRPWSSQLRARVGSVRACVKELRTRGFDESTIRSTLLGQGGDGHRALFEAVLGRQALDQSPLQVGSLGDRGIKAAVLRPVRSWLDSRYLARLDRLHQDVLAHTQAARLESQGLNLLTARRKARRIAKAMMLTVHEWRDEQMLLSTAPNFRSSPLTGPPLVERLRRAMLEPEPMLEPHEPIRGALRRKLEAVGSLLFGRALRAILGLALLGILAWWLDREGILTVAALRDQASAIVQVTRNAIEKGDVKLLRELKWDLSVDWSRLRESIELPIDMEGLKRAFPGANLALAGAILLMSTLSHRWSVGFFSLLASTVVLFGERWGIALPQSITQFDPPTQSMIAGLIVFLIGIVWPRSRSSVSAAS